MLITASHGHCNAYEIVEHSDGFLVQTRDLHTGAIDPEAGVLFRTAAVAFSFADLVAAFDRSDDVDRLEPPADVKAGLLRQEHAFRKLAGTLSDRGITAATLAAQDAAMERIGRGLLH